ncbi:MAG: ABC transporter ATP-binding protein, partial [Clostridiales bacterium]|nr:ABC transporter ATP-binding protein [Clostridiales bacterium]
VQNLCKTYGKGEAKVDALKNVSFSLEKGEFAAVVGESGSGKSTLLKVISGILKPTKGTVKTVGTISPMIELGAGFDMDLTARENIFLNGSVLGYSKQMMEEKFDEILEFSELQSFVDVAVKNYSSGMVARLAFAIATITKPDILIVDEILAVGDFLFQQKCEKRIREMMDRGTTVIIVSHTIEQIERLCKHVLWLEHGNMKMLGDTKTVCDAYKAI